MTTIKTTEKSFNATLKAIGTGGEKLASLIHSAGLFALAQVNEHGNTGFGERLLEAMGKKHDAKRVEKWLCHFGKFGMKSGALVYRARRDILPENLDAWAEKAEATPYWELTEQEHHKFSFDAISMLQGILNRHAKAKEKEAAGDEVSIANESALADVTAILNRYALAKSTQQPVPTAA